MFGPFDKLRAGREREYPAFRSLRQAQGMPCDRLHGRRHAYGKRIALLRASSERTTGLDWSA